MGLAVFASSDLPSRFLYFQISPAVEFDTCRGDPPCGRPSQAGTGACPYINASLKTNCTAYHRRLKSSSLDCYSQRYDVVDAAARPGAGNIHGRSEVGRPTGRDAEKRLCP